MSFPGSLLGFLAQRRLFMLVIRCNSSNQCKHKYLAYNHWGSLKELSDCLSKSVVYNKNDLVVLCKPYGLQLTQPQNPMKSGAQRLLKSIPVNGIQYSFHDVLPMLSKDLGYDNLNIVKIPERYSSGVTVLSPCSTVVQKVTKCLLASNGRGELHCTYWAIVLGSPEPDAASCKVGLTLENNPAVKNDKKPVIIRNWTKKAVNRGSVKVFRVQHHTLNAKEEFSLVEISPSATKWHFIRVYLAYLSCPVLGDNLYGSRVQHLMGVPIVINPFSDAARSSQKLPDNIRSKLELSSYQDSIVPTHIHLQRLTIPNYYGKNKDILIEVPPPPSFQWTCEQLGLTPFKNTVEDVQNASNS